MILIGLHQLSPVTQKRMPPLLANKEGVFIMMFNEHSI